MALKYQSEIDKLGLSNCPANVSLPNEEIPAYRFSYEPIEHEHNFLPNVIIDQLKNIPFNYVKCDEVRKCLRCGASYFLSQEEALNRWNNLPIQFKENVGYTHIAYGVLNNEDGVISEPKKGHFTFYENEQAEMNKKFTILSKL